LTFSVLLAIFGQLSEILDTMSTLAKVLITLTVFSGIALSQTKFYNYYNDGLRYMEEKDWQRAITEFRSATSLEFEDNNTKRIYGTRFIEYFPHREMGRAYYNLGELDNARKELELSYAYEDDSETEQLLELVKSGAPPTTAQVPVARPKPTSKPADTPPDALPPGALTYDPSRVTQVGTRLALAVLPFTAKGGTDQIAEIATEKMVTRLVNLRRFKVIERAALEKIMTEQQFQTSFMVDEQTAVKLGKVVGADAIVLGSINTVDGVTKVNARVIDTETSEAIVAKDEQVEGTALPDIEKTVEHVAIMIYNELPLVEGYVVSIDGDQVYIDLGTSKGIRKGSKCVVFREGDKIVHPVTGEILGSKVSKLGELVVVDAQQKLAAAKVVSREQDFKVGDKVVVK
jgi:TolB-like protein